MALSEGREVPGSGESDHELHLRGAMERPRLAHGELREHQLQRLAPEAGSHPLRRRRVGRVVEAVHPALRDVRLPVLGRPQLVVIEVLRPAGVRRVLPRRPGETTAPQNSSEPSNPPTARHLSPIRLR